MAGNGLFSLGDLTEGFNQVGNGLETKKKMAVLSASGGAMAVGKLAHWPTKEKIRISNDFGFFVGP